MDSFNIRAYAKINLGLDIIGKRPDGYHDIRTVMQTIGVYDEITVVKKPEAGVTMDCSDPTLSVGEDNLCLRAVSVLESKLGLKNGYHISLLKNIPMQAGLGGGSTDAAAVFKAINILEKYNLSDERLIEYSATLGADVAFFIKGGCALAEGIGEVLTPIDSSLEYHILLVKPDFNVSTKDAYRWLDEEKNKIHPQINEIVSCIQKEDVLKFGYMLNNSNVFESVVNKNYPKISTLLCDVKNGGALASCMSGSGSSVYGFFTKKESALKCRDMILKNHNIESSFVTVPVMVTGGVYD